LIATKSATLFFGDTYLKDLVAMVPEQKDLFKSVIKHVFPAYCSGLSNTVLPSLPRRVHLNEPYLRIGAVSGFSPPQACSPQYDPGSVPRASHRAFGLRSRLGIAGFHGRGRERFALPQFFPRSVGFGPTVSKAIGAFTMDPSILCQDHAIPSISSYSAKPMRQSFTKTPFFFHSKKYLCTELALPNLDFGKAFIYG
jgi:hypothetical protein